MSVWFTSDLHLGHKLAIEKRGLKNHDLTILENINLRVNKSDKLYILGDLCSSFEALTMLVLLNCRNIELIFGNHDKFQLGQYQAVGIKKFHGFKKYKDLWLSHCPVHPQELYKTNGNLHGHIHKGAATTPLDDQRYFNVNTEFHNFCPVSFDTIQQHFRGLKV